MSRSIVIYHILLDFMPERSMFLKKVSRVFSRLQNLILLSTKKFIVKFHSAQIEINIAQQNAEFDNFRDQS